MRQILPMTRRFPKASRTAIVLASFMATAGAALAQQTQTEEAERREKVLESLPANAAKRLFGTLDAPAPLSARAIGSYARGCLAGARGLAVDGAQWQVMRIDRNRRWGHPDLIALIERLARQVPAETGWNGLLVGDISQPRGGPMLTGHASHQVGLDADVWLTPMPDRRLSAAERETLSATNMVAANWMDIDPAVWRAGHTQVIRLAARQPEVARIFVNPAIKQALCREAGADRAWLAKVRPMWGHNYHFHIRLSCPDGGVECADQDPPPDGDGCGKELKDWLALQQKAIFGPKPKTRPKPPPPPWTMANLPPACQEVLVAR